MAAVWTLAVKDLRLLWRDKFGMFWVVAFPLMFGLFFGAIFSGSGGTGRMRVALIDEDQSESARAFVELLKESDALKVKDELSRAQARNLVRKGKLTAYVVVKEGFGDSLSMFTGQAQPLEVGIDPARRAEAGYLQGILTESSFRVLRQRFSDRTWMQDQLRSVGQQVNQNPDVDPAQRGILTAFLLAADVFLLATVDDEFYQQGPGQMDVAGIEPVAVAREEKRPHSPFEVSFPSAMLWGIMGCTAAFAISIVTERVRGTFHRLCVAPLSRGHILAGKGLACFLTSASVVVVLTLVARLGLGIQIGSLPGLALAIVCVAFGFTGLMMVFSVLGKTENAVAGAGWAIFMVFAMLGGGMIPLLFMPPWMQTASNLSPVKWGIYALEGAIWRGFSLGEMLLPCGILVGIGIAGFTVGTAILSRQQV